MQNEQLKSLIKTGLFIAIIFVLTSTLKIPIAITGGYTHLGDCAIFLGVLILGKKRGTVAAAFGAALADLLGGFIIWVVPTFLIKGIMAFIIGLIIENVLKNNNYNWLIGAILGGLFQIVGYTTVKIFMFGTSTAFATIPTITGQTVCSLIIFSVVYTVLVKSKSLELLREI